MDLNLQSNNMVSKVTVKDIARLARVSTGTVDRVLHNRGKVSQEKYDRVKKVLVKFNYKPNLFAKSLKNHKNRYIQILMPQFANDHYWDLVKKGIEKGLRAYADFGIHADYIFFDPKSSGSFNHSIEKINFNNNDGLIWVPLFQRDSIKLADKISEKKIDNITINTSAKRIPFIGQDHYKSGRVAGELSQVKGLTNVLIIDIDELYTNSRHIMRKHDGIKTVLKERFPNSMVSSATFFSKDVQYWEEEIKSLLKSKSFSGFIITTSKSFLIAQLIKRCASKAVIIGYDLIEENVNLLKEEKISFLLDQRPFEQGYLSIANMSEHVALDRELKSSLLPIQIATKENVDELFVL